MIWRYPYFRKPPYVFHSVPKRSVQPNQPNPMTFISSSRRHKAFTFIRKASRSASWSSCQFVAAWTVVSIQDCQWGLGHLNPSHKDSRPQFLCAKKPHDFLFNIETIRALTAATVSSLQALHPALPEHQQLGNPWGTWTFAHDMRDQTMPDQDMIQASSTTIKINGI